MKRITNQAINAIKSLDLDIQVKVPKFSTKVLVQISSDLKGERCDRFPYLSIHNAIKDSNGEYWINKSLKINFPVIELLEKPETKLCPECNEEFPVNHEFRLDENTGTEICQRSYEKKYYLNRD